MTSRHLLLLLGTFLLVQNSLGKALPLDEATTDLEETDVTTLTPELTQWDEAESPSDEFLIHVLSKFSKVAESTLKIGKKLLEDVIAEISALDEKSEETTERLERFSEVVTAMNVLQSEYNDDSPEFFVNFQLVIDLSDLLELSNISAIEEPTKTDKLFAEALENNGLSYLEEHFKDTFSEIFSKEFYTAAKRILSSATIEEWPEKENIQEWLEKFNAANDVDEKIEIFNDFFDFYQDE